MAPPNGLLLNCRHLLRCAMNASAQLPQNIYVQRDDFAPGKMAAQRVLRNLICFSVSELRRDNSAVADIVVCVRCNELQITDPANFWLWDNFDLYVFGKQPIVRV